MTKPFTVSVDPALRAQIESARDALARGGEKPSAASIVRECIRRGLPALVAPADGAKAG